MIHADIRLYGRVQGVGFRFYTTRKAKIYQIRGWVKNMADGSVKCKAEGEKSNVQQFIKELKKGPRSSNVRDTEINKTEDLENYSTFEVRY